MPQERQTNAENITREEMFVVKVRWIKGLNSSDGRGPFRPSGRCPFRPSGRGLFRPSKGCSEQVGCDPDLAIRSGQVCDPSHGDDGGSPADPRFRNSWGVWIPDGRRDGRPGDGLGGHHHMDSDSAAPRGHWRFRRPPNPVCEFSSLNSDSLRRLFPPSCHGLAGSHTSAAGAFLAPGSLPAARWTTGSP
jgi:hypothetical protein